MKNSVVIFLSFWLIVLNSNFAAERAVNKKPALFKICRSKDANEIYYTVKTTPDGNLDRSEPIGIYWIKFTKNGSVEPLTTIQNTFAYGLKFLSISPEKADFQFVSYSKRTFSVHKTKAGNFSVFTTTNGAEVEVERIYIQIDGGTFWLPKISKVELYARFPEGGEPMVEIIRP